MDAIGLCVPLRPPGCSLAEAQSSRLSAAVAAASGCVPRGQWAPLDTDMPVLIDRRARSTSRAAVPATFSVGVFVSFSLTVLCTLSSCHLFVPKSSSFRASLPCNHVENGVTDLQDAEL